MGNNFKQKINNQPIVKRMRGVGLAMHHKPYKAINYGDGWRLMDNQGNLLKTKYEDIFNYSKGFLRVKERQGNWIFISKNGEMAKEKCTYVGASTSKFVPVKFENGLYGFVNMNGVIQHDRFKNMSKFNLNGKMLVQKLDDSWFFVDEEQQFEPVNKDSIEFSQNNVTPFISLEGTYRVFNKDMKLSLTEYKSITDFKDGYSIAQTMDNRYTFINIDGKVRKDQFKSLLVHDNDVAMVKMESGALKEILFRDEKYYDEDKLEQIADEKEPTLDDLFDEHMF